MNIYDGTWVPIPSFEGFYVINKQGVVCNAHGHLIKHMQASSGPFVELRKLGQRERISIDDLLLLTFGENNENM